MNYFTKDELQKILQSLIKTHDCYDHLHDIWTDNLACKVNLMIVNYCKHERCTPVDALNVPLHCLDCGFKFE